MARAELLHSACTAKVYSLRKPLRRKDTEVVNPYSRNKSHSPRQADKPSLRFPAPAVFGSCCIRLPPAFRNVKGFLKFSFWHIISIFFLSFSYPLYWTSHLLLIHLTRIFTTRSNIFINIPDNIILPHSMQHLLRRKVQAWTLHIFCPDKHSNAA